ncbi:HAD family hydrolase [Chloroflexota bacterium]
MPENNDVAIIWDMDGVIVDTAIYHLKSWQQVLHNREVEFTGEDFKRSFGQRNDTIIRKILGDDVSQDEISAIAIEKEAIFRCLIKPNLKSLPGVIELLKALVDKGFSQALVSSAPLENINLLVDGLGILKSFQCIISGEDVTEGKPSPQGFLLAAEKLEVKPEKCIVIEDAVAGVSAAQRAGMCCLAVTNTHPRGSLLEADLIVDSLEAVNIGDLEDLLK